MIKKSLAFLFVFTALVIMGMTFSSCPKKPVSKSLKIGALLPQTGPGAVFADYIKKGLDLAAEENNAKVPGSIQLLYADSKNDPNEGVSVFRQMVLTDKPPVVIAALSSVTKAVAPLAQTNNTVVIGTAVGLPNVTAPSDFVFRVYPEAHGLAGVIAAYAATKYKTAAVAYINDDFGVSGSEVFRSIFEKAGGKVLVAEPFLPVEKDFRNQWQKIKAAKPECVWIIGYGPAYSVLVNQFREAQITADLLADMTMGLPATLKNTGKSAEGIVYVDATIAPEFAEKFQKKYGEKPTSYSGYAYDIVNMLYKTVSESGATPEQIKTGFAQIKAFPGAMGSITIEANRDANVQFKLMQIKNGEPTDFKE